MYTLSTHAQERIAQRRPKLRYIEAALRQRPRPAGDGCVKHYYRGVELIVNPKDKVIVTIYVYPFRKHR